MDVLEAVRDVLIDGELGLSSGNCYVSAVGAFVAGSSPFYVQVCDGGSSDGADQGGNALSERVSVKIAVFVHMNLDQEGRAEQALIKASVGLRARVKAIREVLSGNWLDVEIDGVTAPLLTVPLHWQESVSPIAHPADPDWVQQDVTFVGWQHARIGD